MNENEAKVVLKALKNIIIENNNVISFLTGKNSNSLPSKLLKDPYFKILNHKSEKEIVKLIEYLKNFKCIKINKFVEITPHGIECLSKDEIFLEKTKMQELNSEPTHEENKEIEIHKDFLKKLNAAQKKAIVCKSKKILCVAGAGSGKTTVLTKRIKHLTENLKVNHKNILAITFTKKAKENMFEKLENKNVSIHTFNSFAEKIVQENHSKIYNKKTTLISYKEKRMCVEKAINFLDFDFHNIKNEYFTKRQINDNGNQELFRNFVNDIFTIKDYFQNNNTEMPEFYKTIKHDIELSEKIYRITKLVCAIMKKNGWRDFSDQLTEAVKLISKNNYLKERYSFKHILIDEYQDINPIQECLVENLNPENIFCVGDPRQSIYGWRGSRVEFIENMGKKKDVELIYLNKNYRCDEKILDVANNVIKPMNLPNLISGKEKSKGEITLNCYESKKEETLEVAKKIKESKYFLKDIYVIARTNSILNDISENLIKLNIKHIIKNENSVELEDSVVLATVHSVKGLEAKQVFLVGCTNKMFPCLKQEHKILEIIKDYYDKNEEELRLLYVAITRAENELHISYYGKKISKFISPEIIKKFNEKENVFQKKDIIKEIKLFREKISKKMKIPENLIFTDQEIDKIVFCKNLSELKKVIGSRATRYGSELVKIIENCQS